MPGMIKINNTPFRRVGFKALRFRVETTSFLTELTDGDYPSTKRTTGLHVGEFVLWCGMFAPKGRLEWYHAFARGAPLV